MKKIPLLFLGIIFSFNPMLGNEEKNKTQKEHKVKYGKSMVALSGSIGAILAMTYFANKPAIYLQEKKEKSESLKETKIIKNKKGYTFVFDKKGNVSVKDVFGNKIIAEYKNPNQIPPTSYNTTLEKKDGKNFVIIGLGLKGGQQCHLCLRNNCRRNTDPTDLLICNARRDGIHAEKRKQKRKDKVIRGAVKVSLVALFVGFCSLAIKERLDNTWQGPFYKGILKGAISKDEEED